MKVEEGLKHYQMLLKFLFQTAHRNDGVIAREHIISIFISSQNKFSIAEIFQSLKILEAKRIIEVRENEFAFDLSHIDQSTYDGNVYDFREQAHWNEQEHELLKRLMHHVLSISEYIERSKLVEICGHKFSEAEILSVLEKLAVMGDVKIDEYTVSVYI